MKYTVDSAIARIERNKGKIGGKVINISDCGIKVWGAVDFLVNHHGYTVVKQNAR